MIRTKQQRRRNRKLADPGTPPVQSFANVLSVTASGAEEVTIAFDAPVLIAANRLPLTWRFGTGNRVITGMTSTTGTDYVFAVGGSVAAAQAYSMPAADPAARTNSGGYVATSSGNLA